MARKLILLLIVCVLAVASNAERGSSSTVGFLPRKTFTNVKSSNVNVVDTKYEHELISSVSKTRGGAISIPHPTKSEIEGTVAFIALDILFRKGFKAKGISFPSQLGGCCILFVAMLLSNVIKPGLGDAVFAYLTPGALLLAKWIPVFFVPGLAMLPLAPSMGNTTEILKVLFIVVAGFYYSCATTAYAVLGLRKMQGSVTSAAVPIASSDSSGAPKPKPFSTNLVNVLGQGLILTGALSIGAAKVGRDDLATPLNAAFMLFTTFYGYVWGARLHPSFVKIIHPLVTSTVVTLALTQLVAALMGKSFESALSTYKVGSMSVMKAGAGDVLLYLLGPSVVSFAISIYSRKQVIADNILTVFTAMMIGSVGGLFGTAFMVRLLQLGGDAGTMLRKSMLPRNITTPLAIAITNIIGGDIAQACAVVVLTGIYGATFGQRFLNSVGITDPVSRGLGMGASAQGLGVATMMSEAEAFPFAAVSMVLTAMTATTLVSIPAFAKAVVGVATGN